MEKLKVPAAALAVLLLAASAHNAQQSAGGAALEETLKRLEKTLNRHGSLAVAGFIRRFEARSFRSCKISYELVPQVSPDHKGYVPFTERTTFDLSALDPARVVAREGQSGAASVGFATRGDRPLIEHQFGDRPHNFGGVSRAASHYLRLSNKKAAEDVRDALIRAAELCGSARD